VQNSNRELKEKWKEKDRTWLENLKMENTQNVSR
jgi:hypothetical protein